MVFPTNFVNESSSEPEANKSVLTGLVLLIDEPDENLAFHKISLTGSGSVDSYIGSRTIQKLETNTLNFTGFRSVKIDQEPAIN